jgi:hypothetical protein
VLTDSIVVRLKSSAFNNEDQVRNRQVTFKAPANSGITFSPATAITDTNGIARTQAKLGSAVGRFTIDVNFVGSSAVPWTFQLEAAAAPSIASVSPSSVNANGSIVINGSGFNTNPLLNEVYIDGARASITSATSTRLEATVPACLPSRTNAKLLVRRGALESPATTVSVTGSNATPLTLNVGQSTSFTDAASLGCLRLVSQSAEAEYIVITQQTQTTGTTSVPMRLLGLRTSGIVARPTLEQAISPDRLTADAPARFEKLLYERTKAALAKGRSGTPVAARVQKSVVAAVPVIGEKKNFHAFVPNRPAQTITAQVRAVTNSMAVYEDVEAAGLIPQSTIDSLVTSLDDPIFSTVTSVFGTQSDLDFNQRVIILLTPAVNRLTAAGETSFLTGYFDPCDMLSADLCPDTNRSEILYSFVPDPDGKWGLKHPLSRFKSLLPPLAAHEFQHLVHFNQRTLVSSNLNPEDLWLNEAMAHFSEDTVAGVMRNRGLTADADRYARENYNRATNFLKAMQTTSLVASTGEASLEERGAGWLFLKYLVNRVGGNVLRRIENTALTGTANAVSASGVSWTQLMRDFSVALWASGTTLNVPATQSFGPFNLRAALATVNSNGVFPLIPTDAGSTDFTLDWSARPSSTSFVRVVAPAGGSVNLTVAGERGGAFATSTAAQVTVLRVK